VIELAHRPIAAVLVSLLAVPLIVASRRRPALRETWTFLAAAIKLALVASMLPTVVAGGRIDTTPLELAPGFALHLRADAFGIVFATLASALWLITSVYSVGYMRAGREPRQTGYFVAFAVCLSATIGIALAANLVTFLVFYEVLTVATYPLVVHSRSEEAKRAGRRYLAYTAAAGQALLVAVVWTAAIAPGEELRAGGFLAGRAGSTTLISIFALFMIGCGAKAALLPLHGWLPDAMIAPTPVSALLHAVAVVKAGVFGCLRIVGWVFGIDLMSKLGLDVALAVLAATTILVGSIRALDQNELKRRLAYSTVSQLSYIVLGAALGSAPAIAGAVFHMVAHGFMKITLFFCAGAIHTRHHLSRVSELRGLGRRMPLTFGAFTLAALGLAGTPLVAGFVSKWQLGLGALAASQPVYVAVLLLSGVLNLAYFFPIVRAAYFDGPGGAEIQEAGILITGPLLVTAAAALLLGIFPDAVASFHSLAWQVAGEIAWSPVHLAGGAP
jgi:multicomponent Na+:H+ antiporter subunit D